MQLLTLWVQSRVGAKLGPKNREQFHSENQAPWEQGSKPDHNYCEEKSTWNLLVIQREVKGLFTLWEVTRCTIIKCKYTLGWAELLFAFG